MTLSKELTEKMRALAADGASSPVTEIAAGPVRVRVGDVDRYSATVESLTLDVPVPTNVDRRLYLSSRAAAVAQRLSFLEEPLAVWELDGDVGMAQLRSNPPERNGEEISYWEVQLQAAEQPTVQMGRYSWSPSAPDRATVSYPATFALLGRIADALQAALNEPME